MMPNISLDKGPLRTWQSLSLGDHRESGEALSLIHAPLHVAASGRKLGSRPSGSCPRKKRLKQTREMNET